MNTDHPARHLSYSQINSYMTCPLRYKFHYIDEIPPAFTTAALAFGSGIHEAVAAFYHDHLTGYQMRPDQMVDVYRNSWRGSENVKFFNGDNEDSLLEKATSLLGVFHNAFDPSVSILGVEEFFEVQFDGLPVFQGYIDLIEQSTDGTTTVVDLKTASRKLTGTAVHGNMQLTAYSLGAEVLGFAPDSLNLRLDVLLKTKSPELVRYETSRTNRERERFTKLVAHVWNGIQSNVWYPKEDWHCSQCPYTGPCKDW